MSGARNMMVRRSQSPAPVVAISTQSISESLFNAPVYAAYELNSNGQVIARYGNALPVVLENWITPQADMAGFQAMAMVTGGLPNGGVFSGTLGEWLNLGTTQQWALALSAGEGWSSIVITVEIRSAATLAVVATAAIELIVNSNI